jgi:hypothetical protein
MNQIKLVLPVCKKEAAMVSRLVHRFKSFGDMVFRDLVLIAPWEDKFEMPDLEKFLRPIFQSVTTRIIPDLPEFAEWPAIGNHVFYETCKSLHELGNKDPWYFFECDNWPLHPGWLDEMQIEYNAVCEKTPFMGAVNLTRTTNLDTGQTEISGKHMVGTAIYPADFFQKSQAIHLLTYESWDIEIAPEIMDAVHETPLIFHAWHTGNYRRLPNKQVIGDDLGPNKGRYGGRPIPPETVVVHGCKDASLSKIDFGG